MRIVVLITLMCVLASCSNVRFRTKSNFPVKFSGDPSETKEVLVKVQRDFLLWGLAPKYETIYVDQELEDAGYSSLSKAIVYEKREVNDVLIGIITLGFYLPKTYYISGFTEK